MMTLLALRDNETGTVLEFRALEAHETADHGQAIFAAKRQQYSPPRYELVIGVAPTLEAFTTNYPRFAGAPIASDADADADTDTKKTGEGSA